MDMTEKQLARYKQAYLEKCEEVRRLKGTIALLRDQISNTQFLANERFMNDIRGQARIGYQQGLQHNGGVFGDIFGGQLPRDIHGLT